MINANEIKKITEEAISQHEKRLLDYFEKKFNPELETLITEKASQGKYNIYYIVQDSDFLDYPFSFKFIVGKLRDWIIQYGYAVTVTSFNLSASELSIRWGELDCE